MSRYLKAFRQSGRIALEDVRLQQAIESATGRFRDARTVRIAEFPDVDLLRAQFKDIRSATLGNLGEHLDVFTRNAAANGTQVHFAQDAAEACNTVLKIAQKHGAKLVAKSKSMATEEIHLNKSLEAAGMEVVETDLGEWIVQLAQETPSHIIAPAVHKTRQQVAELFTSESGYPVPAEIPQLTAHARKRLREKFLAADIGISGGNIAVADTGSIVLVTNEGNGRMVTTLPRVHIAVIGIEKVAPSWREAGVWLSLLARSATGQPLSIYTNIISGPKRPALDEIDGPEEVHVVFLDNGRSKLLNTKYEEILQCIRCGACLNICPVYRLVGGHSYRGSQGNPSPYSGPIGAVISPLLFGLEDYAALPQASSLCGACKDVCPVNIDLPRMLIELRADSVTEGLLPAWEAAAERGVARIFTKKRWMRWAAKIGRMGQKLIRLNVPEIKKQSFHDWWEREQQDEK